MDPCQEAYELALRHHQSGRLSVAEQSYRAILQTQPRHPGALHGLGVIAHQVGKLDRAVAFYRQALSVRPDYAEAYSNLGMALRDLGRLDDAVACYRQALLVAPDQAETHNNLGNALKEQGKADEATACFQRALELRPTWAIAHSNALLCEQYRSGHDAASLAAAHAEWAARHAAPLRNEWQPHDHDPDPVRHLRLGFVSSDLVRHPVAYLCVRALEALARYDVQLVFYSGAHRADDMTARFRAVGEWRDVGTLSDEALAAQVRRDRIDVLFDLAGHTRLNRLLVFARKPAPVQITWLGYEGTTGLKAMDWLIADRYICPETEDRHYPERVVRLPSGYVGYDPLPDSPPVGPPPVQTNGHVTFGSFSNLAKINPEVVAVWSELLRRLPGARLVLKYRGLDDPGTLASFRERFEAAGVASGRIIFAGPSSHGESLAGHREIDIALDPFPFAGSATTLDALWMGVPAVTLAGATFAGRHGHSHLTRLGHAELVAHNREEYLAIAECLARDEERLAWLRSTLRQAIEAAFCNGARLAEELLAAIRHAWAEWCARRLAAAARRP